LLKNNIFKISSDFFSSLGVGLIMSRVISSSPAWYQSILKDFQSKNKSKECFKVDSSKSTWKMSLRIEMLWAKCWWKV